MSWATHLIAYGMVVGPIFLAIGLAVAHEDSPKHAERREAKEIRQTYKTYWGGKSNVK